jgi:mono/diheme cytochrome c family protein
MQRSTWNGLARVWRMRGCGLLAAAMLAGCGAKNEPGAPPAPLEMVESGRAVYARHCASCHGANGAGVPGVGVALTGSRVARGDAGALLRWLVREDERPRPGRAWPSPMPSFANLDDAALASVSVYVRQELAGRPGVVTPAQAAAAR